MSTVNAYWNAVKDHLKDDTFYGGPVVDWARHPRTAPDRHDLVGRYSWTITDPRSVAFVAEHAGPRLLDPMAGSGWWCRLLADAGADILAYDLAPPHHGGNTFHGAGIAHVLVATGNGPEVAATYGAGRTLLLSWPPYDRSVGGDVLAAYPGDRVIYIGEGEGGCCGDDKLHALMETEWTVAATHRPVQWWGVHDYITVLDRAVTQ